MMIKKWAEAAAIAALALTLSGTVAQAAEARPAAPPQTMPTAVAAPSFQPVGHGPAPDEDGELVILSNEEYARRFGNQPVPTPGVLVPLGPLAPTITAPFIPTPT